MRRLMGRKKLEISHDLFRELMSNGDHCFKIERGLPDDARLVSVVLRGNTIEFVYECPEWPLEDIEPIFIRLNPAS